MKYIKFIKGLLLAIFVCIVLLGITFFIIVLTIEPEVDRWGGPEVGIKPSINKASLSVEAYININGVVPTGGEFIENLNKFRGTHTRCIKEDMYYCIFDLESNTLGERCDNSNWKGNGKYKCYYRNDGNETNTSFRISAKSFNNDFLYVFDSEERDFLRCNINDVYDCELLR